MRDEIRCAIFAMTPAILALDLKHRREMSQANDFLSPRSNRIGIDEVARTVVFAFRCKTARVAHFRRQKQESS
jgi:hypothetical protein